MIKSKINRRPEAEGKPIRYVSPDPKDKALFRAVKHARAKAEQLRSSGNATAAREMTAEALASYQSDPLASGLGPARKAFRVLRLRLS